MQQIDKNFLLKADASFLDWVDFGGSTIYGRIALFQDELLIKLGQFGCGYMITFLAPIRNSVIAISAGLPPLSDVYALNRMRRCGLEESLGFSRITFEKSTGINVVLTYAADNFTFIVPIYEEHFDKLLRLERKLINAT